MKPTSLLLANFRRPVARRLLAILFLLAACALPARGQQLTLQTFMYQGVARTWYVYVPKSYNASRRVPLVLALHGYSDTADKFAKASEWMPEADAKGFIVVFPNGGLTVGQDFGWNAFIYDGSAPDDAGFLFALIQQLQATYQISAARIYMSGFSNGGGMTSTFAALHTSVLAAIAPISGGWQTSFGIPESLMHPDAPIPAWVWRGSAENFMNGSLTNAEQDRQQTDFWRTLDGDAATPEVVTQPPYTTSIYRGGRAEVRFTSIAGADHSYQPGTSAKLWDGFFSIFRRQGSAIIYSAAAAPILSVTADAPMASAATGTAGSFLVSRTGDAGGDLAVQYALGGLAINGRDYHTLPGTRTLAAGKTAAHIRVRPLPVAGAGTLSVRLTLLPGAGYTLGSPAKAKVQIVGGS